MLEDLQIDPKATGSPGFLCSAAVTQAKWAAGASLWLGDRDLVSLIVKKTNFQTTGEFRLRDDVASKECPVGGVRDGISIVPEEDFRVGKGSILGWISNEVIQDENGNPITFDGEEAEVATPVYAQSVGRVVRVDIVREMLGRILVNKITVRTECETYVHKLWGSFVKSMLSPAVENVLGHNDATISGGVELLLFGDSIKLKDINRRAGMLSIWAANAKRFGGARQLNTKVAEHFEGATAELIRSRDDLVIVKDLIPDGVYDEAICQVMDTFEAPIWVTYGRSNALYDVLHSLAVHPDNGWIHLTGKGEIKEVIGDRPIPAGSEVYRRGDHVQVFTGTQVLWKAPALFGTEDAPMMIHVHCEAIAAECGTRFGSKQLDTYSLRHYVAYGRDHLDRIETSRLSARKSLNIQSMVFGARLAASWSRSTGEELRIVKAEELTRYPDVNESPGSRNLGRLIDLLGQDWILELKSGQGLIRLHVPTLLDYCPDTPDLNEDLGNDISNLTATVSSMVRLVIGRHMQSTTYNNLFRLAATTLESLRLSDAIAKLYSRGTAGATAKVAAKENCPDGVLQVVYSDHENSLYRKLQRVCKGNPQGAKVTLSRPPTSSQGTVVVDVIGEGHVEYERVKRFYPLAFISPTMVFFAQGDFDGDGITIHLANPNDKVSEFKDVEFTIRMLIGENVYAYGADYFADAFEPISWPKFENAPGHLPVLLAKAADAARIVTQVVPTVYQVCVKIRHYYCALMGSLDAGFFMVDEDEDAKWKFRRRVFEVMSMIDTIYEGAFSSTDPALIALRDFLDEVMYSPIGGGVYGGKSEAAGLRAVLAACKYNSGYAEDVYLALRHIAHEPEELDTAQAAYRYAGITARLAYTLIKGQFSSKEHGKLLKEWVILREAHQEINDPVTLMLDDWRNSVLNLLTPTGGVPQGVLWLSKEEAIVRETDSVVEDKGRDALSRILNDLDNLSEEQAQFVSVLRSPHAVGVGGPGTGKTHLQLMLALAEVLDPKDDCKILWVTGTNQCAASERSKLNALGQTYGLSEEDMRVLVWPHIHLGTVNSSFQWGMKAEEILPYGYADTGRTPYQTVDSLIRNKLSWFERILPDHNDMVWRINVSEAMMLPDLTLVNIVSMAHSLQRLLRKGMAVEFRFVGDPNQQAPVGVEPASCLLEKAPHLYEHLHKLHGDKPFPSWLERLVTVYNSEGVAFDKKEVNPLYQGRMARLSYSHRIKNEDLRAAFNAVCAGNVEAMTWPVFDQCFLYAGDEKDDAEIARLLLDKNTTVVAFNRSLKHYVNYHHHLQRRDELEALKLPYLVVTADITYPLDIRTCVDARDRERQQRLWLKNQNADRLLTLAVGERLVVSDHVDALIQDGEGASIRVAKGTTVTIVSVTKSHLVVDDGLSDRRVILEKTGANTNCNKGGVYRQFPLCGRYASTMAGVQGQTLEGTLVVYLDHVLKDLRGRHWLTLPGVIGGLLMRVGTPEQLRIVVNGNRVGNTDFLNAFHTHQNALAFNEFAEKVSSPDVVDSYGSSTTWTVSTFGATDDGARAFACCIEGKGHWVHFHRSKESYCSFDLQAQAVSYALYTLGKKYDVKDTAIRIITGSGAVVDKFEGRVSPIRDDVWNKLQANLAPFKGRVTVVKGVVPVEISNKAVEKAKPCPKCPENETWNVSTYGAGVDGACGFAWSVEGELRWAHKHRSQEGYSSADLQAQAVVCALWSLDTRYEVKDIETILITCDSDAVVDKFEGRPSIISDSVWDKLEANLAPFRGRVTVVKGVVPVAVSNKALEKAKPCPKCPENETWNVSTYGAGVDGARGFACSVEGQSRGMHKHRCKEDYSTTDLQAQAVSYALWALDKKYEVNDTETILITCDSDAVVDKFEGRPSAVSDSVWDRVEANLSPFKGRVTIVKGVVPMEVSAIAQEKAKPCPKCPENVQFVALAGHRDLPGDHAQRVRRSMDRVPDGHWLTSEAKGTDATARAVAKERDCGLTVFSGSYRDRSIKMLQALKAQNGILYAWVSKPADKKLKPPTTWSWPAGSDSAWGTIALAWGMGIEVAVFKLGKFPMPSWFEEDDSEEDENEDDGGTGGVPNTPSPSDDNGGAAAEYTMDYSVVNQYVAEECSIFHYTTERYGVFSNMAKGCPHSLGKLIEWKLDHLYFHHEGRMIPALDIQKTTTLIQ